jgi:hypothetical protein
MHSPSLKLSPGDGLKDVKLVLSESGLFGGGCGK